MFIGDQNRIISYIVVEGGIQSSNCGGCSGMSRLLLNFLCTASVPVSRAAYGSGIGSIFLDDLLCEGTESSLLECPIRNGGRHNCNHSEDAGVQCEGT